MKKFITVFLSIIIAISFCACGEAENALPQREQVVTINGFEDYKNDFQPIILGNYFGKVEQNREKEYVKSGNCSAKLIPSGCETENDAGRPILKQPLTLNRLEDNDLTMLEEVSFEIYSVEKENQFIQVWFNFINGESSSKTIELKNGWNTVSMKINADELDVRFSLDKLCSLAMSFERPQSVEKAKIFYLDDVKLHHSDDYKYKDRPNITFNVFKDQYFVGESIKITATALDKSDGELPVNVMVFVNGKQINAPVGQSFILSERGRYELRAEATNKHGVTGKAIKRFLVLSEKKEGLVVDLSAKEIAMFNILGLRGSQSVETGYAAGEIGGRTSEYDGFAYVTGSKKGDVSTLLDYPNFYLNMCVTKKEAKELSLKGYDRLSMNVFLEYEDKNEKSSRIIVSQWGGVDYSYIHAAKEYGENNNANREILPNRWTEVYIPLSVFLNNFDSIGYGEGNYFFYVPNDPNWNGAKQFKLYLGDVSITKSK